MSFANLYHGGRLDEAMARYGGVSRDWLDLSTAISPKSYPVPEISNRAWQQLPQQRAIEALNHAARRAYGAPAKAPCAVGGGTQAFIQVLPHMFKPQTIAIAGFTYQEHGACWQRAGHSVLVADGLESAASSARIIVVVNPNNPDGQRYPPGELAALAKRLAKRGGLLIVDEAFADVAPEISTIGRAGQPGLLVLRSFGKFFGLAGLRLGFAFGHENLIERLADHLGPWPVSGPAIAVGARALPDQTWQKRTRKKLAAARRELDDILNRTGLEIVGGTDLFALTRHRRAAALFTYLAKKRILTRPFPGRKDWLRFGLPGTKPAQNRLKEVLTEFDW